MKTLTKTFLFIAVLVFSLSSCIDNKYDVDDLNKNAVFKIPPVPLGNLDTLYFNKLGNIALPPEIEIPSIQYVLSDTVKGLFSEDDVSKFFPLHAEDGDYSAFVSKIDIVLKNGNSTLDIVIIPEVLDDNQDVLTGVIIPWQELKMTENQKFSIEVKSQYMKHMQYARDLKFTIIVAGSIPTAFTTEDYIFIKNMSLQTSGLHFKF